jgi:uncharacterized Zn finger protein (UPF0148 family)
MADFIRNTSCEECGSSDGKSVYSDGSYHCWVCKTTKPSQEWLDKNSDKPVTKKLVRSSILKPNSATKEDRKPNMSKIITTEQHNEIKSVAGFEANNFRGITNETLKFFGCCTSLSESDEVIERYYPVTIKDELTGYKVREVPKTFYSIGEVGNKNDLYGSFKFRSGGKYVLIVGGEEDCHAAYQMLKDYSDSKRSDFVIAVVSVTTGETSAAKQIAANYEFLNNFENIIIGFDNDEAGKEGTEKIISSLPKGKVKIATWSKGKDPNEILMKNQARSFISDFYAAKAYVPAGVVGSDQLYEKIVEQALLEKVPLPSFLKKLQDKLGDGLALGHIYNIAAMTSIGKSSIINEMIYHWIFNSPHMIGVVSMELNSGQYGETLLSRHIQLKLAKLTGVDKLSYLNSEAGIKAGKELFSTPEGTPRFYLVDDRDGTVEQIQETIEQMIISSGVKLIVIDPLQDLIEGMSNEDQGLFMKWCKSVIKSHNVSFVLINHMRKKNNGDDSIKVSESDIMGSSTISKSASANILLARDKEAEDQIERNTTYVTLPKSRLTGDTGSAGKIYYDNNTHTMYDFDDYFSTTIPAVSQAVKPEPKPEVPANNDDIDF